MPGSHRNGRQCGLLSDTRSRVYPTPALTVSSGSRGEVEALTGVRHRRARLPENDYNLSCDPLKLAEDPRCIACPFEAWEVALGPWDAEGIPTGVLQALKEGVSAEPGVGRSNSSTGAEAEVWVGC